MSYIWWTILDRKVIFQLLSSSSEGTGFVCFKSSLSLKRIASLEKENKRLTKEASKQRAPSIDNLPEQQEKARFTSKGIHSLRRRLHLTQAEFAKLVGATTHSVYLWEKKEGPLNLRDKTKAALLSIKGLRARDAKEKPGEVGEKRKRGRKAAK